MKQIFYSFLGCFLLVLMCFSCSNKQYGKHDLDQLMSTINENDNAWNNLDADKIVSLFAPDGTLLNDDSELLRGHDAIRKSFEEMQKPEKLEFKRDKVEVKLKGNFAYEIVNQTVSVKFIDQEPHDFLVKYIHIWEKQDDGSWRVLIDMNNTLTPSGK
jgi:uncharacterized protein (TIGR02246 family)